MPHNGESQLDGAVRRAQMHSVPGRLVAEREPVNPSVLSHCHGLGSYFILSEAFSETNEIPGAKRGANRDRRRATHADFQLMRVQLAGTSSDAERCSVMGRARLTGVASGIRCKRDGRGSGFMVML